MFLKMNYWKDKRRWLIEVPDLDLLTQGKNKKDAFEMIQDAVCELVHERGFKMKAIDLQIDGQALISSNNDKLFMALLLKRQREMLQLSLTDMAKRLEVKSRNTYAQYERGQHSPTFEMMERCLKAINPQSKLVIQIV